LLLIDWIFHASELGKKYYKAVKYERANVINGVWRNRKMRETAEEAGQNNEKLSLLDLLIQCGDISKEEIVGEIATTAGAGTETTSHSSGYVLALLGDN
jgi:cytochrome P450